MPPADRLQTKALVGNSPQGFSHGKNGKIYRVCYEFLPFGGTQIPLNPPFSKGDFNSNSL
jgi:hypothetical protein